MPIYEYECEDRHRAERLFRRHTDASYSLACPDCGKPARRVISAPAIIDVRRDWNDNASDMQRDPYTQSKAQLTNMNRAAAERGEPLVKVTEKTIQVGAKAIHEQNVNPQPDPEDRQIAAARKNIRKARREKADRAAGKIE